jgi:AraC-like DNA-binding protein
LRSLSQKVVLWHWKNLIHLLPSLIAASVILAFKINVIDWLPWTWPSLSATELAAVKFVWAIVKCLPLIYVLACFHAEYRLRQQLKQMHSSLASRELFWADLVLGGFFIHWFWSFVAYFLGGYFSGYTNDLLGILNNYFTVILVNTLFVFGLINTRQLPTHALEEPIKAASLPQLEEKIAAIERGIHVQKLYLESQINLERFSEQIGVKSRDVSAILNSHYQSNFFEFINRYRIEEAKRLLVLADGAQDTILDIVFKSGFNSQSAFHRFFKRLVGVTPSEYRNQKRSNDK